MSSESVTVQSFQ